LEKWHDSRHLSQGPTAVHPFTSAHLTLTHDAAAARTQEEAGPPPRLSPLALPLPLQAVLGIRGGIAQVATLPAAERAAAAPAGLRHAVGRRVNVALRGGGEVRVALELAPTCPTVRITFVSPPPLCLV